MTTSVANSSWNVITIDLIRLKKFSVPRVRGRIKLVQAIELKFAYHRHLYMISGTVMNPMKVIVYTLST